MKTLFNDLANRHKFINDFYWGNDESIGASRKFNYPVLMVQPIDATMLKTEQGTYKMMEHRFEVKVVDLVEKDESSHPDVESDTLQILTEIVIELNENFKAATILIMDDTIFEPLDEFSDDDSTGWSGTITIKAPIRSNKCFLPFAA